MTLRPTRRMILAAGAVSVTSAFVRAEPKPTASEPFGVCLNTSTVRLPEGQWGKPRGIVELIDIAAKSGYSAIEPWVVELQDYVKAGGSPKELGKRFADAGLEVPDAIGFAEWVVEDPERRKKGLEQAKRDMELVAQVGGQRIAAPPVGATGGGSRRDDPKFTDQLPSLLDAADRYRALFDLGKAMGVTPIVELWGHSQTLRRFGEAVLVAAECGTAGGAVLPDVYHLYKGGSDFAGLGLAGPRTIGIFHVNDYPAIERTKIVDQDRVFPGDGVAPLAEMFRTLAEVGYRGYVSLELFNHQYWKRDPYQVAKEGLDKLKAVARSAGT